MRSSRLTRLRASAGPLTSARATARLSATIGVGLSAKSWSYSTRICGQSVRDSDGASLWTALIAAWIWYGPGWLRRRQARTRDRPSAIKFRFQPLRSWSASKTRSPSGVVRVCRRDSVSNISASRPAASGSSGINSVSSRPSRIASVHRFSRTSRSPELAV